jgi:hypothetical protein
MMIYSPAGTGESHPPTLFLLGEVEESSIYIRPDGPNANPISNIKTFKFSYHLSFHLKYFIPLS